MFVYICVYVRMYVCICICLYMYEYLFNNDLIIFVFIYLTQFWTLEPLAQGHIQSCTQIIRPLARFYSYDYDLRKTNYIFK